MCGSAIPDSKGGIYAIVRDDQLTPEHKKKKYALMNKASKLGGTSGSSPSPTTSGGGVATGGSGGGSGVGGASTGLYGNVKSR